MNKQLITQQHFLFDQCTSLSIKVQVRIRDMGTIVQNDVHITRDQLLRWQYETTCLEEGFETEIRELRSNISEFVREHMLVKD